MRSFENDFLHDQPVSHDAILLVARLAEQRGRQEMLRRRAPHALERLREHAVIQSVECSNRLEGVEARPERLREILVGGDAPRERSECEIAGYRTALERIHRDHARLRPSPELALELHRELYALTGMQGGAWKRTDNEIVEAGRGGRRSVRFRPVSAAETPAAVETLHRLLARELDSGQVHPLLITAAYVLDFLCIHPFGDGNGRVARLLTLLLLYRCGYEVGRYVSLERIVEANRQGYYEALRQSSMGWHGARHSLRPWTEFLLGTLARAGDELDERTADIEAARGTKGMLVEEAIERLPASFRMRDIEAQCPTVSRDMIRVVLGRLKEAGRVRCEGSGAGAVWLKGEA
jgi:Fic family protein